MNRAGRWLRSLALTFAIAAVPPAHSAEVRLLVFFHPQFQHYFMSADPVEIAALDASTATGFANKSAWHRTGTRFRVSDAPENGAVPVCRFSTSAFAFKTSHFFTASAAECEWIKQSRDWIYEGIAFYARLPAADGSCGADSVVIRRYYNNGRGGAPNHAYTHDVVHGGRLQAAGYTREEDAFCVPTSSTESAARTALLVGTSWDFPAFPDVFSPDPLRIAFADAVRSGGSTKLAQYGLRQVEYFVYFELSEAWTSYTGWDPLADGYILVGGSGFEGMPIAGISYQFDSVDGQSVPACSHVVTFNFTNGYDVLSFQPYLWSGCRPGQMVRQ